MAWMFTSLQNSYMEVLTPKVMVLGGGGFGRWLVHEGRALVIAISTLIEETLQSQLALLPHEVTVWTHGSLGSGPLTDTTSDHTLILGTPVWRTVRNKFADKPSGLWYFGVAAVTD